MTKYSNQGQVDEIVDWRDKAMRKRDQEEKGTAAFAFYNGKVVAYNQAIEEMFR